MSQSISKKTPIKIGDNLSFRTRYHSIVSANIALQLYTTGIKKRDEWVDEGNKMPIFLDTCVLLNLYDISETERVEFIKFIEKNKDRIYISSQVQREYIRNRLSHIKGFKDRVTKMKTDLINKISKISNTYINEKDGITNLINQNLIKYGMPQVASKLKELEEFLNKPVYNSELQDKFKQCIDFITLHVEEECEKCWRDADFEYNDPIQTAIAEAHILSSLSEEEKTYIINLYKNLRIPYDELKSKNKEYETIVFPGAGDKTKPVDDPIEESIAWGDLYIYHEMLRFMIEKNTDVVFMTCDVAKKDWIKQDHRAYVHYIVNGYEMTGHLMYILDAEGVVPTFNTIEVKIDDTDQDEISEKPVRPSLALETIEEKQDNDTNSQWVSGGIEDLDNYLLRMDLSSLDNGIVEFKPITETQLMTELLKTTKWAKSYGAGYVGESHFVYNILRHKHYDYKSVNTVLDELISKGKIVRRFETHDNHTFNCLYLINE